MYENYALFENLTENEIKALKPVEKTYHKDSIIIHRSDKVKNLGLVLFGKIQVYENSEIGNKNIIVSGSEGFIFGESLSILNMEEYPISIQAQTDCRILFISSESIRNCTNMNLTLNLMKILAKTNIDYRRKINILEQRTTREKLLVFLREESRKQKSTTFDIVYDRQALADYLAVERSAMSAEISKLVKEKVIETRKNHFRLIKPELTQNL